MIRGMRIALPGAAALLVLTAGAAWVCPGGQCGVTGFDAAGLTAANAARAPWLDALAAAVTWAGSLAFLLPVALLLAWRERRTRGWRVASYLPASLLAASALAYVAKFAVLRPRPELFAPLAAMPADASFPSAHAMQAAALVTAWLCRPGARPPLFAWLAGATLVTAVALSRVHLQLHHPSDVIAGVGAGLLLTLALRRLAPWQGAQP